MHNRQVAASCCVFRRSPSNEDVPRLCNQCSSCVLSSIIFFNIAYMPVLIESTVGTCRIKRFQFSIWCALAVKQRSEAVVVLRQAFPPESHIPARRAGQHSGMWSVDSEQKEGLLHRMGSEISSWLGHELEAKPQPHFTWTPSPTAMMATVAGTTCYCGAVYCGFFLNSISRTLCKVLLTELA